jgi:hypothetical protein
LEQLIGLPCKGTVSQIPQIVNGWPFCVDREKNKLKNAGKVRITKYKLLI